MNYRKTFLSAVLAGICIALGGLIFLSVEDKTIGALLFTIGLFTICTFGFHLFTGKVCYAWENDQTYRRQLPLIWAGNFIGTGLSALCASFTRNAPALSEKAKTICEAKLNDSLLSLFLLGFICNIFIYIAVEGYRNNPHEGGKYLSLFLGVMGFILCGSEHCVADMFYFSMASIWSFRAVVVMAVITAGNTVGGLAFAGLHDLLKTK